ncbi:TPA: hypothetical protein ACTW68_003080 [Klebsiella pneumoniae]
MKEKIVYLCIALFIFRVLFLPLFLPVETYGFRVHAVIALILLCVASRYMINFKSKNKASFALFLVMAVDAFFFVLSKDMIYGDYPYYPRYALITLPLITSLIVIHYPNKNKKNILP